MLSIAKVAIKNEKKKKKEEKKKERKKMPTLSEPPARQPCREGSGPPPFLEPTGRASAGDGRAAGHSLSLGLEGHPTTRGPLGQRAPVPRGGRVGAGGAWRDRGQRHRRRRKHAARTEVQARPGKEEDGLGEKAGGEERSGPAQAPWPSPHTPCRTPASRWPARAMAQAGVRPLLRTLPSPYKQSGRTHRPSRSFLFGSQSCEMQQ